MSQKTSCLTDPCCALQLFPFTFNSSYDIKGNNDISLSSRDGLKVSVPFSGQGVHVWGRQPHPLPAPCQCVCPQDAVRGPGAHPAARQCHHHHAVPGQGRAHHPAGEGGTPHRDSVTSVPETAQRNARLRDGNKTKNLCWAPRPWNLFYGYIKAWCFTWGIDHSAVVSRRISVPVAVKNSFYTE